MTTEKPPTKPLSIHDWDVLISDFQDSGAPRDWFTSVFSLSSLLDLALTSLLKKDFPLQSKLSILVFLDEFSHTLFHQCADETFDRFIDALRAIVQSPATDGSNGLKEQALISFTSVVVTVESFSVRHVEGVVDLLLTLVNRPNHGFDRQARAVACECLRQVEIAFPGLLSDVAGHLWLLCQAERTHAVQAYLLLFTTVVYNVVHQKIRVSLLSTSVPLVPFNAPSLGQKSQGLGPDQKELRRTLAFMLESPYLFTSCAMMEFMGMVVPLASALELQASMLKVQFLGMVYSFDPMLCHVVLLMYTQFPDAFEGQEKDIMRRLMLLSKETQIYLVFRLLALHWLMGLLNKVVLSGEVGKRKSVLEMGQKFHPEVFDPLALKALKLDFVVHCSVSSNALSKSAGELLVSVSDFKWLPPWSSETAVAFRTLHKFLICGSTHSDSDPSTTRSLMESSLFQNLQVLLVEMTSKFQILVPVIVSFIERLINCEKHQWLGERFLQTIDEKLLPKLEKSSLLTSYFPLLHRIAENDTIPPSRLIELLTKFVVSLVDKRGFDVGLKLWDQGTEVLGICRTLLSHHKSSRLFLGLSRLLSLMCLYFPDLDVRDNARIYLRMLVCIPGRKLKNILKPADTVSPSTHSSAFFTVQSPRFGHDPNKSWNLSSYIHLIRVTSLLVKQSWSLSLPSLGVGNDGYSIIESKVQEVDEVEVEQESSQELQLLPDSSSRRIESGKATLRVMDAKIGEILERLRRYFSLIPDLRHMPGIKVRINCTLRLDAEQYSSIWGSQSQTQSPELDNVDSSPPALFATVLKFSSSAPYGSIPSCRIPFLQGETHWDKNVPNDEGSLEIVLLENTEKEEERGAPVTVELEPREPTPGLVEVSMEANAENGQMIEGKLESVPVGIEDMFLKALAPPDEPEDTIPSYYSDLFNALWEVCGSSSSTAHETFALKGGKTAAAISGTRSVKLLEVPAETVIQASELHLAPFVVAITGEQLVNIVREGGIIENIVWQEEEEGGQATSSSMGATGSKRDPLRLTYIGYGDDQEVPMTRSRGKLGKMKMLMFLPPRYHLLFEMEVGEESTLVHIRTDYWPSLAYVDDYLEALFLL